MLPIVLVPNSIAVGIAGKGEALAGRLRMLERAGFDRPIVINTPLSERAKLAGLDLLFVAGLSEAESRELHAAAKSNGVLVNVEDVPKLCDFHVPAQVRRGDLLITISTGGRAPGLSATIREFLEEVFGEEWETQLEAVAVARARWRSKGLPPKTVAEKTREFIAAKGWMDGSKDA